jgi:hypothetical protein
MLPRLMVVAAFIIIGTAIGAAVLRPGTEAGELSAEQTVQPVQVPAQPKDYSETSDGPLDFLPNLTLAQFKEGHPDSNCFPYGGAEACELETPYPCATRTDCMSIVYFFRPDGRSLSATVDARTWFNLKTRYTADFGEPQVTRQLPTGAVRMLVSNSRWCLRPNIYGRPMTLRATRMAGRDINNEPFDSFSVGLEPTEAGDCTTDERGEISQGAEPVVSDGPSFDCARAENFAERAICDDSDLARRDRALAERYAMALQSTDRQAFQAEARSSLRARRICGDVECVEAWFAQREAELSAY